MNRINLKSIFPACKFDIKNIPVFSLSERTVKDYFDIAEIAYENIESGKVYQKIQCYCLSRCRNSINGYFGAAFLDLRISIEEIKNERYKPRIIFAHRGTNTNWSGIIQDFVADIFIAAQFIGKGKILPQFWNACELLDETINYLGTSTKKINAMHTGHSLGAALAQMCAHDYSHKSIGFETPGMAGVLNKLNPNKPINNDDHISFVMQGSYVSRALPHSGKVFSCLAKDPVIINPIENIKQLHSMKNMASCFNSDGNFVMNPKIIQ